MTLLKSLPFSDFWNTSPQYKTWFPFFMAQLITSIAFFYTTCWWNLHVLCVFCSYIKKISRENNCKSRGYLKCIGLLFQVFFYCSRIHFCFFICVSLSQISVQSPEQMPLFVSFCQHLFPDFASLMFSQHVIDQSLSPASILNLSIKSCRTII